MLINEGAPGSLQSYYELVRGDDLFDWGGELLLRRKRLCGLLAQTYSYGATIKVGAIESWPIVFGGYLHNMSTKRRCG